MDSEGFEIEFDDSVVNLPLPEDADAAGGGVLDGAKGHPLDEADASSDDYDSHERSAHALGATSTKKKLLLLAAGSAAIVVLVIGLGAGLGSKSRRDASASMSVEQCMRKYDFSTSSLGDEGDDDGFTTYIPTEFPTTYVPTMAPNDFNFEVLADDELNGIYYSNDGSGPEEGEGEDVRHGRRTLQTREAEEVGKESTRVRGGGRKESAAAIRSRGGYRGYGRHLGEEEQCAALVRDAGLDKGPAVWSKKKSKKGGTSCDGSLTSKKKSGGKKGCTRRPTPSTPSPSAAPSLSARPSASPSGHPSASPIATPSASPSFRPSASPSARPTAM
ncbi:hypothetical protein ACHAWF_002089, partial [Thalassiosira exigua]